METEVKHLSVGGRADLRLYVLRPRERHPQATVEMKLHRSSVRMGLGASSVPFLVREPKDGGDVLSICVRHRGHKETCLVGLPQLAGKRSVGGVEMEIVRGDVWRYHEDPKDHVMSMERYFKEVVRKRLSGMSVVARLVSYLMFQNMRPDTSVTYVRDLRSGEVVQERMYRSAKFFTRYFCGGYLCSTYVYSQVMRHMTHAVAARFDSTASAKEIPRFIDFFGIDMSEVRKGVQEFKTFNEFFSRELKAGSRRVEDAAGVSSPADCRLVVFGSEEEAQRLWIKGSMFSVRSVVGAAARVGWIGLFRLAPMDYHRFHAPFDCHIESVQEVDGKYLTVHPKSVRHSNVLSENKRVVVRLRSREYGRAYFVLVGAALVGSIVMSKGRGSRLRAMEEMGYFRFGGSTILMVMEGNVVPNSTVYLNTLAGIETAVKVGDCIGKLGK